MGSKPVFHLDLASSRYIEANVKKADNKQIGFLLEVDTGVWKTDWILYRHWSGGHSGQKDC